MPLRLNGSTSGFSQLDAPAIAGDQTFTLPGTGGTIDRLNRAGNILQVVEANTATTFSTSAVIPFDDTIPQNTEGAEILTASITPTSSSNKLYVVANFPEIAGSATLYAAVALFQDATTNAMSVATAFVPALNNSTNLTLTHYMTAGTTSSTTFKLRCGPDSGFVFVNRFNASRIFGGSLAVRMTIIEIAA